VAEAAPPLTAPGALFVPEGDAWRPGPLARGPWDPGALHGGPPAALLARALERLPAPGPVHVARVTVELLRPVPFAPLAIAAEVVRLGRSVQLCAATLQAGGRELARASAVRIRRADAPVTAPAAPDPPPGPPAAGRWHPLPPGIPSDTFGGDAVEARWLQGDWGVGPGMVWMRLRVPLVPGESPTPLQRALATADFGNGVSAALPWRSHLFINPDLTVYLERPPAGEWVGLAAVTRVEPEGVGVAESVLYDERGRIGRALQALYVAAR
jgi:Thioesterase-like superfamily